VTYRSQPDSIIILHHPTHYYNRNTTDASMHASLSLTASLVLHSSTTRQQCIGNSSVTQEQHPNTLSAHQNHMHSTADYTMPRPAPSAALPPAEGSWPS
jgi:hypothetical protein